MTVRRRLIASIRKELAALADPDVAEGMRAYMKSELPCHGVKAPIRRKELRSLLAQSGLKSMEDFRDTCRELFVNAKHREERYVALDLIRRREYREYRTMELLPLYEELIVVGAWWDHVDEIASHLLGELMMAEPKKMAKAMRRWAKLKGATGDDLWRRRAAILCQLRLQEETDLKLLEDCMRPAHHEKEFFLRKAIGWALRAYAYIDAEWVRAYVARYENELSGLSKREALKNI